MRLKYKSFPFYAQLDGMDCGPSCIRMIAAWYGKKYSLQELRNLSYISKTGVNMLGLSRGAESIGLRAKGLRLTFSALKHKIKLPCIAHWGQRHFVVIYKIECKKNFGNKESESTKIYVADPASGKITFTESEFCSQWISTKSNGREKGFILTLEPTPFFYNREAETPVRFNLQFLVKYLRPYRRLTFQLLWGIIVVSLIQLFLPFLTQAIIDQGISGKDIKFIYLILISQLALIVGRTTVEFVRRWILLHIGARINISIVYDFLTKLMKLPISYFDKKLIGDHLQRIGDHERIEQFLTQSLLNLFFSIFNIIAFSIVLAIYSLKILSIFFVGSLLYAFWIYLFIKKRAVLDHKNFAQMSLHQANLMQLILGMQEIKLTGSEEQKKWQWGTIQAKLYKIKMARLSLSQWQQGGAVFINETKNIIITILSATAVLSNELTLGSMLSIQFIIGQMQGPIEQMVGFITQTQDALLSLERLGEIHSQNNEENDKDNLIHTIPLENITFRGVSFQYPGSFSEWVFKDISLTIPKGKVTAIVGSSGSGKTTLLKLLLGFYQPTEGEISLNDIQLDRYSITAWRSHCGVVLQDGYIFNDTIANNIAPACEFFDERRIIEAIKTSNLQEFVSRLPLKYNTKIGNEGRGLSQGQRQRILIARAVYKNPEFILFDEATSALDANNEKVIMKNVKNYFIGRTVILIAHRLSTIKDADQILVMDRGQIIECGTHDELIRNQGAYYGLFKNQMDFIKS